MHEDYERCAHKRAFSDIFSAEEKEKLKDPKVFTEFRKMLEHGLNVNVDIVTVPPF